MAERVGVPHLPDQADRLRDRLVRDGHRGGIQAQWTGYVEPAGSFALDWTVETVNAAIIGGVGTIVGPLTGAAISVGISQRLANYPTMHLIILGVLLIVVIRLAPTGLWGAACQLARAARGRYGPAWRRFRLPAAADAAPESVLSSAAAVARLRPLSALLLPRGLCPAPSPVPATAEAAQEPAGARQRTAAPGGRGRQGLRRSPRGGRG